LAFRGMENIFQRPPILMRFDDVDSRQNVSPASRIFADSMGDSTWPK
jgi:hypothetical protein